MKRLAYAGKPDLLALAVPRAMLILLHQSSCTPDFPAFHTTIMGQRKTKNIIYILHIGLEITYVINLLLYMHKLITNSDRNIYIQDTSAYPQTQG